MLSDFIRELDLFRGIHPGVVLGRKLKDRGIKMSRIALDCREYPQTLNAIIKGRRNMNTALALKLERALDLEEGFFMILQVYHDIHQEKMKEESGRIEKDQSPQ